MNKLRLRYKRIRISWQRLIHKKFFTVALAGLCLFGAVLFIEHRGTMIDSTAYRPLLDTIAKGESNGNYNAYFGHPDNTELRFTRMTVAEVMAWQQEYVRQGSPSNAVGRYQFISPTLARLVKQLHISPQARFDEALQDRLAIALIEPHGSRAFIQKKLTAEQFAANLATEWAALPRMSGSNPHQSYYAGDGLNQARIDAKELLAALDKFAENAR